MQEGDPTPNTIQSEEGKANQNRGQGTLLAYDNHIEQAKAGCSGSALQAEAGRAL